MRTLTRTRTDRTDEPSTARPRRILLVADRTATGQHVRDALAERGPCDITLLVPAARPSGGWTWDEDDARDDARRRMETGAGALRRAGYQVRGVLGDFQPLEAIRDAMRERAYDEILISTLPARLSRWLRQDLPARAARAFAVPVTHVEALTAPDERAPVLARDPAA
jgi:hypothetical protein